MRTKMFGLACLLVACATWSTRGETAAAENPLLVAPTGPRTPEEQKKLFHLPPGFEIELVAAEPAIAKPMNLAFDGRGRLWVSQSLEYPFAAPPGRPARDAVKILEDTDGDGYADKITTFADGLNIPIGVLPIKNGALVHSIPNVYRMVDTDGDGRADKREVLFGTIGHADTHGMTNAFTWGFDGRIYACHGFANDSTLKARDGSSIRLNSGNTYRIQADGTRIEQHTWGQVNPFGLSLTPLGDLFSADCHSRPVMMLLRGGYYQSFGKPHDGLGFAPEICNHDHGSTGIAGIVYYAADQFPPEYRATIFVGNVVTNRINHDRLTACGSTLTAVAQPDFLRCDDPWFRPVDIKLGPDGALYVADFYNKIIGHYEVHLTHPGRDRHRGRIWRISYRGKVADEQASAPGNLETATIPVLIRSLGHPNLVVRIHATNELVDRADSHSLPHLEAVAANSALACQRLHAMWALERLRALTAERLSAAMGDEAAVVRVHALRILAERAALKEHELGSLVRAFNDPDPFVRRAAAEAAGRHPNPILIRPLLALRQSASPEDTQLVHTVRIALRNQLQHSTDWKMLALEQALAPQDLVAVADVAPGAHTPAAAEFLIQTVSIGETPPDRLAVAVHHAGRYGSLLTQDLAFHRVIRDQRGAVEQARLFREFNQGLQEAGRGLAPKARAWSVQHSKKLLESKDWNEVVSGVELAGILREKDLVPKLLSLAKDSALPEGPRRAALDGLMQIDSSAVVDMLGAVLADASEPLGLRERASDLLAVINTGPARAQLLKGLVPAPANLQSRIAGGLVISKSGADGLLQAVREGKASARLLQERLVSVRLDRYEELRKQTAGLTQGLPSADDRLQALLAARRDRFTGAKTDQAKGQAVFEKNCAICHQIAAKGNKIGPQLDGIGNRGLDRLLEDLLDPNRNVDQAFRATNIVLKSGRLVSGLVLREEGEVVVVADAQGKELRVAKQDIDERTTSLLSPMPANVTEQIREDEFYNLLAYLLAQKPTASQTPSPK